MQASGEPVIEPLGVADFDEFLAYLDHHLADNGGPDTGYFQPLPRNVATFPPERAERFRNGLGVSLGEPQWRRARVARSAARRIVGHVDLRAHPEPLTEHRCLLGLGVDRAHRRVGLGTRLVQHAADWAAASDALEWVDLRVLSANEPAMRLYSRLGFKKIGEVPDMFRIDGHSFSYTTMTRRLSRNAARDGVEPSAAQPDM